MRALLIEFDLATGKRAGDINPKDPALPCYGWQNLEREPAIEIRLVEDELALLFIPLGLVARRMLFGTARNLAILPSYLRLIYQQLEPKRM